MRALLDTHALRWWLDGDDPLSLPAREFIGNEDDAIWVSAAWAGGDQKPSPRPAFAGAAFDGGLIHPSAVVR
jgi:hypothetical protein